MQDASFMAHAILEGVARAGRMMCIETLEYALAGGSVHVSALLLAANQHMFFRRRVLCWRPRRKRMWRWRWPIPVFRKRQCEHAIDEPLDHFRRALHA